MNSVMPLMPSGSSLSMNSSLLALSSSRCATHAEGVMAGWLTLSFHRGKKLVTLDLLVLAAGGLWDASIGYSFSASYTTLEIIRIHLLITACLEVCHHHFKLLRHPTVEAVTLQFDNMIWQKVFQEWRHENLEVPWQMHLPTLTPSPSCPFAVGRAPGSMYLGPWHHCNVHPAWQVCHLKWCLSLSFLPTPKDSPVRKQITCREGGCWSQHPVHDDSPLNPNANFD